MALISLAVWRDPEAAQRIRATSIALELAAALDDWALVCPSTRPKADTTWKDLLAIARAADPDPFRNKLRDAWEERDLKALENVAASEKAADLPPASVAFLGGVLRGDRSGPGSGRCAAGGRSFDIQPTSGSTTIWPLLSLGCNLLSWTRRLGIIVPRWLCPENPGVHTNLGVALSAKGRLDEAIAEYQEAIRLKKDYSVGHTNLGLALHGKGRLDEAIAEYQEAIRLKKDDAEAHDNLGTALYAKGRLDEAIAEFREAIRLKKDYALAHYNLGFALAGQGPAGRGHRGVPGGHPTQERLHRCPHQPGQSTFAEGKAGRGHR